ncbi:MAG: hypothetical protein ACJ76H_00635 [Bacteriovoracaceae bacterium]
MKFLTAVLFLSVCANLSAQTPTTPAAGGQGQNMEEMKQHRLGNIDKRIGYLNELKSCISAASTKDAFHACEQTHKQEIQALKSGNQSWRQGRKAERQARKANKQ